MSLIVLAERLRAGRAVVRTLLLMIALTAAVIVGLLAMHSLNTQAAADMGSPAAATADMGMSADADAVIGADADATTAMTDACSECGAADSNMLTMACVLALLATVLLLTRSRGAHPWILLFPRRRPRPRSPITSIRSRPPSLTALCISRT